MKMHQRIWLPDHEQHLLGWMDKAGEMVDGRGSYQIGKFRKAVAHVSQFRTAIDVGAHSGMWSMQMAKKFMTVHAFEPISDHRECFEANMSSLKIDGLMDAEVILHPCALGDHEDRVVLHTTQGSSGDTMIEKEGSGDIPLCTMDSFNIANVDFIKLDCEGYELFALKGGEQTIKNNWPVICVEQKPGRGQRFGLPELGAVEYLMALGYECVEKMSGDFVMVPR